MHAWGLDALIDDLTLIISELTTNAVRHALAADSKPPSKAWLGIARTGKTIVCAVSDPSPTPPAPHHAEDLAQGGRGLHVVKALTSQWGYAKAEPTGKTVWARVIANDFRGAAVG
ncbi:ATP-binding protein [Streptomyces sp. NPDC056817]|uniref:ATP-binding protein n=1 Tax=Streptomyces sp. NPDC056817 TaxID=3345950 RepID=UPI0036B38FF4